MRAVGKMLLLLGLVGAAGCTGDSGDGVTNLDGGCTTCVPDGGRFSIYVVDATNFSSPAAGNPAQSSVVGFETIPLFQMALAPSGNIGIAYVEFSADQTDNKPRPDPSLFNYDILYVEWSNGNVVVGPEHVTGTLPVQEFVGVSLDYFNGQPVVGFLGWVPTPGYDSTQAFWYQHAAVLSYRNLNGGGNPGTWTQVTVANNESVATPTGIDEAAAGTACAADASCYSGPITGLYPAVFADGTETILAYRNVHFGSSTGTGDFANSNLDIGYGGPSTWQYFGLVWGKPGIALPNRSCALTTARGGNGDHNKFVHGASNNPALIGDRGDGTNTYNSNGTDVVFFERQSTSDTNWNCPLSLIKVGVDSNAMVTETGPYMAYDGNPSGQGYAVAVTDTKGGPGSALYKNCGPGKDCTDIDNWSVFRTVYETGSGGFFASVALNPDSHDPWVAYYFCSSNTSASVTSCPVSQRQLQVATSTGGTGQWTAEPVDNKGAWQTQMLYLTNPTQLVIGYRDPASGALKLAVENPQ
jgi:hypothetical protein